ncbi:hypothetical protein E8E14_007934 [Neopestalotiopsis sp. 37M]|nr:hypothetical protein E8E14_007934 [Neopestalotiopsis sp. 37M]
MPLCTRCSHFNIQAFAKDGFPYRGYPLQAVVQAARSGACSFCSMILEHLILLDEDNPQSHLNRQVRKEDKKSLPLPLPSEELFSIIRRYVLATVVPVWVHFSVKRGNNRDEDNEASLDIVEVEAFVSTFSDTRRCDSGRTNPIHLCVAADEGMNPISKTQQTYFNPLIS